MVNGDTLKRRFELLEPVLDERLRRLFAAAEAEAIGRRGSVLVSEATGVSRRAIRVGQQELLNRERSDPTGAEREPRRIRKPGGGRKKATTKDATLRKDLNALVDPLTCGDPESPLRWTCKSVRTLTAELKAKGHQTSHRMVAELLHEMGYSLQANRKTREGAAHPDRDAQFHYINTQMQAALTASEPAISVDTKKKELIGDFRNGGQEWRPQGQPEDVRVHDFKIPELGRVAPYGVYDIGENTGWVAVGTDHDTAEFAVATIRSWWLSMGRNGYPQATKLLITADGGGSNGSRLRLWKTQLQRLADEIGLPITVCHFPPGTSKWNKIEHRLFSFITQNWRGKPLVSHEVIFNLIAATTTNTGLRVHAELDSTPYPLGQKVTAAELAAVNIKRHDFHGDWNYTISPAQNGTLIL
ncbi:ISAzo13 family transposase [Rhabdochromatium marinum]|uniref:ISAzo13 family transposase n=1 Tax=Rhabdochromatium marinum TaxID=48729 RepID=UPI001903D73B|nr:ISAzo13 family transposase [Rhabdochromatium marinum]MBK1648030.1 ISAzo13 family transposase [Rhabdochromatium marinum]